ncbi:hypothetical protein [Bacillus sp. 491mf]|uniref:hypothetical protein n=1 Tax=Bacillus sp. 491mf TaxID=1761755 RepID=UPI000B82E097|nr:hypothetical protein [Bacillus sp. 491mf]
MNDKGEKVTGVSEIDGQLYLFSKGDDLRVYGEKIRNTYYRFNGKGYIADIYGRLDRNGWHSFKSGDIWFEGKFNNEGVITESYRK